MDGFEDSRRLPAAWECDETNLSSLSETSEQADQILEITEEELIQVQSGAPCVIYLQKQPLQLGIRRLCFDYHCWICEPALA